MNITNFSFRRPLLSYSIVKKLINALMVPVIRNKAIFLSKKKLNKSTLLQVGCGTNYNPDFVNLDYIWQYSGVDILWDITKSKLPFKNDSLDGIYTEHCLEHITLDESRYALAEFYRILKKNAVLRVVVPDGRIYIDTYIQKENDNALTFPYNPGDPTSMISFNRIFYGHGHKFIYDCNTMKYLLEQVGFREVQKQSFRKGRKEELLIDTPHRAVESLYVECIK